MTCREDVRAKSPKAIIAQLQLTGQNRDEERNLKLLSQSAFKNFENDKDYGKSGGGWVALSSTAGVVDENRDEQFTVVL